MVTRQRDEGQLQKIRSAQLQELVVLMRTFATRGNIQLTFIDSHATLFSFEQGEAGQLSSTLVLV
jgi:hypothetical protein